MILEHLITGYLDGALSAEQDRELRSLVKTDPLAKEAFDAAVLIHIAMRCEDDTEVPLHVRSSVMDAVDAFAAVQGASHAPRSVQRPTRRIRSTAAVLLLMAVMWLPIGYGTTLLLPVPELDHTSEQVSVGSPAGSAGSDTTVRHLLPLVAANSGTLSPVPASTADLPVPFVTENSTPGFGEGETQPVPLMAFFGSSATLPAIANSESTARSDSHVASGPYDPWQQQEPLTVVVSTAYAAGMASTIASAGNVEQISASLAYGLSENDAFGLELGSTAYTIEQSSSLLNTSEPVSSMMRSSIDGEPGSGKLSSPESNADNYTVGSQEHQVRIRAAWGGAFYERRLAIVEDVSLSGRAGAGLSEDGVLGYGRVSGQWMIGAGISVLVGAEARTMPFQTGAGAAVASQTTYGAVLTAVTGVQIRF